MDMEDVLLLTAGMLADDERVAAQVRRQYKWFVVDEFQDVSPLQSALLDLWLGGRDELCVVGDPAQTIYSFAGANADLPARLPAASSPAPPRSSWSATTAPRPEVVAAANTLLAGTAEPRASSCVAQRPAGPDGDATRRTPDEVAEAEAVAGRGRAGCATPGRRLGEVAVLFRINAQSEALRGGARARAASPTSSAAPPASSTAPRCARR